MPTDFRLASRLPATSLGAFSPVRGLCSKGHHRGSTASFASAGGAPGSAHYQGISSHGPAAQGHDPTR